MKTKSVPRLWPGETVAILASGPSMTAEDAAFVRGKCRVIAINSTYALAPWADCVYACDARLWRWHWEKGPKGYEAIRLKDYRGLKFGLIAEASRYGVTILGRGPAHGLSLDPAKICLGGNSGYQAINVAVLLGATRIILLGYDMGLAKGRAQHWHGDHPNKQVSPYANFQRAFPTMVHPLRDAGVEVINCSRETRLTCFERKPLTDVFPDPAIAWPLVREGFEPVAGSAVAMPPACECGSEFAP